MLLILMSVGASAAVKQELTFGAKTQVPGSTWYYQNVTDAKSNIEKGDFIVVSFDEVKGTNCQYAICDETQKKIYTEGADPKWECYTCKDGDKNFTFTVDDNLWQAIQNKGLQIQYQNLSNVKIYRVHINENWKAYAPTTGNPQEIMSTPQFIDDWYQQGYVLTTTQSYLNKTLRVVCLETTDDSYAYLKRFEDGWPSLMSGSDKFSIAGWKYFEIKVNDTLDKLLQNTSTGLLIGGNNYIIAGIYAYDDGTEAPTWKDDADDVIDTYTVPSWTTGENGWGSTTVPGSFFEYKSEAGSSNVDTSVKIANTKNNIICLNFDGAVTQCSAKDGKDSRAAYIRQRGTSSEKNYVDYADCSGKQYYDFELSDAITVFSSSNQPIINSAEGVMTGMLSKLLVDGMTIGTNGGQVKTLEIRKSWASKYITGYAVYTGHHLANDAWRAIALPYNLDHQEIVKAFGNDVRVCELGQPIISKDNTKPLAPTYHITINFDKIGDTEGINANYPYLIKLNSGVKSDDHYPMNVKADVRDFQAYEFRTKPFNTDQLAKGNEPTDQKSDEWKIWNFENGIKNKLTKDVVMLFKSTAPVFDITNESGDKVEIIHGVKNDGRTILKTPNSSSDPTNYFLYDNTLYPVLEKSTKLKSGLAYVVLPAAAKNLFTTDASGDQSAQAKLVMFFDGESSTTGINDIVVTRPQALSTNVYTLAGQLIRKGTSIDGLPKGVYIVGGKKYIVK